jgi:pyruvate/2-oxoglutarate dehydrogenase complex dihydrolipoamide dehydrogenase (E3) component
VVGGGAIGVEMAQAFSRFGVRVTVVEVGERLLAPEEPEASKLLADVFAQEGIQVHVGVTIEGVSYDEGRFTVTLSDEVLHADKLLVAAGRRPHLADIGLDTVGLDPTVRALDTDSGMRVKDGLWAIGDITGNGAFTHMSMYEAAVAADAILDVADPMPADYRAVPHVTFTDPEVASVGITERQARDQGLDVRVGLTDLSASTRGWIQQAQGLIKLVEDRDRGVLVGATVVGPAGGEILSGLVVAVHGEVPTKTLASMIYAYPTLHRALEVAVQDLHDE